MRSAVVLFVFSLATCGLFPSSKTAPEARSTTATTPTTKAPERDRERIEEAVPELTTKDVCSMKVTNVSAASPSAKPFTRPSGLCFEPFCDIVEAPPPGGDLCFVATKNISRAERDAKASRLGALGARAPWNAKGPPPKYLDRVLSHLHLDEEEEALLGKNGFVVLDRIGYSSYAVAYHDVFQQELPVYISIDAILNAVFQANQMLLEEVERTRLGPKLVAMIERMRSTLARSKGIYDDETIADLDVYLGVARRLLHPHAEWKESDVVETFAQKTTSAEGLERVTLFGRDRMIDFSQYAPRGHYANTDFENVIEIKKAGSPETERIPLADYFRAMTWLSRLELNLVSRSSKSSHPAIAPDPSETPREARNAIALADLVSRSGSLADLKVFEDTYSVFAGKREDVSVPDLLALSANAGLRPRDDGAPAKLKAAIGDRWKRTARTHFMPQGSTDLPVITTLFGARVVPDIAPLTDLVHDAVPERKELGAADVGYVLGQDRAKTYLAEDLKKYPALETKLDKSRAALEESTRGRKDVYGTWLRSIVALGEPAEGVVPSFMKTDAFADARLSSALAGYAQIRHTFVLLAGQGYDAYGCEIPDGFVEPAVATYDALLAWVAAAKAIAPARAKYFARVAEILGMLRTIARAELEGAALTEPQRRWLAMVSELTPRDGFFEGDSGSPPKYTGWYFDLFPDHEKGAERPVDLVADYFTLTNTNEVRYLGIDKAAMGVFVIDTSGEPRAMVGPVVKPYDTASPIATRLDDKAARKHTERSAPWLGYLKKPKPEPTLSAQVHVCDAEARVVVQSPKPLGDVTIELLDHHGDPLGAPVKLNVERQAVFAFALPKDVLTATYGIEGMHLRVHDLAISGTGKGRFDMVSGVAMYRRLVDRWGDARPTTLDMKLGDLRPPPENDD